MLILAAPLPIQLIRRVHPYYATKRSKCCLFSRCALLLLSMAALAGCGGSSSVSDQPMETSGSIPVQPPPSSPNQFSMFGYTWAKHASKAPGGGTFSHQNAGVSGAEILLTLHEDSSGSDGAEIATVTPLSYGTYTFTYWQDQVLTGSIASGFSYLKNSETEIDVEQQGQYPFRWDFTNWTSVNTKETSFADGYDAAIPHTIQYVWEPGQIRWYIDGQQVAAHTKDVPSQEAPFLFNFWGTNKNTWGGSATPGIRHMIITKFSYQPM
jgi:hypothetical protein